MKTSPRNTSKASGPLPFYKSQGNEIELFEYAWRNRIPLLIKGPTGCGKTRFIQYMAAKLNQPLYTVCCHNDLTAADLIGRHLLDKQGSYWNDGPLTRAIRGGGICYLDEVVEAHKDTAAVLYPLTDYRRMLPLEGTAEILHAPDNFMLVISYNPSYQNLMKSIRPSTRQRFIAISFNFPAEELGQEILIGETGIDEDYAHKLVKLASSLRSLKEQHIPEVISTRLLVYAATLIKDGLPVLDACRASLVEPLTDDAETISILMEVVYAHFAI